MRKLAGVPVMIGILVGWALLASEVYRLYVEGAPRWLELGYFAVAGLTWFVPAALAISWMSRRRGENDAPWASRRRPGGRR